MSYDPRSIANVVLGLAKENDCQVTHLSLQKIIYFIHGRFLTETGQPLVSGSFEAWKFGPVHPAIYSQFKDSGYHPIDKKASIRELKTGEAKEIQEPEERDIRLFVRETAERYLKLSPGRLVELSHAINSPWDAVTRNQSGGRDFGMRISEKLILSNFRHHKVSVGSEPRLGEPSEESLPS